MKKALFAILALFIAFPIAVKAADMPSIGLFGPTERTDVQLQDVKATYRFDQMNEPGKSAGMVPVQMTAKVHNFGSTQNFEIAIPIIAANNLEPIVASVFINGREQSWQKKSVTLAGMEEAIPAATFRLQLVKDAEAILDVRVLQPLGANKMPFLFSTASGWRGEIPSGTLEAITPFAPFNWNMELRRVESETLLPLNYANNQASYGFANLIPSAAQDVYWHYANLEALEYFARGNERFQKTQGDAKSFEMMRQGLLDMIPCNGVKMPLQSWWINMYETVTLGVIGKAPEGQERLKTAMKLWSDNWNVPTEQNKECAELKQRPDRYKEALEKLLMISPAERTTHGNDALKEHNDFLKEISAKLGDGSIADSQAENLAQDENLSETDRALLAGWDSRFASQTDNNGNGAASPNGDANNNNNSFVSSTINNIKNFFPNLSLASQILLFFFIAVILIIIIILIISRWRDSSGPKPPSGFSSSSESKKSSAPSFMPSDDKKKDFKQTFTASTPMRDIPAYPPAPKVEPKTAATDSKKDSASPEIKKSEFKQDQKTRSVETSNQKTDDTKKNTGFNFTKNENQKPKPFTFQKPGAPEGPVANKEKEGKRPEYNKASDPPWIKKDKPQELIKPKAPPPKPNDNNFPWAKKDEQKKNNEQPPGPTVNI